MTHSHLSSLRLSNGFQQFDKPRSVDVKRLAAFDAGEFNGAEDVAIVFVMADYAGLEPDDGLRSCLCLRLLLEKAEVWRLLSAQVNGP